MKSKLLRNTMILALIGALVQFILGMNTILDMLAYVFIILAKDMPLLLPCLFIAGLSYYYGKED